MTVMRAAACLVALSLAMEASAAPGATISLRQIAGGLSAPVELVHAGDGSGRLFVVEQPGTIRIVKGGTVLPTPFLDISALVAFVGERGLLGLAFHPGFQSNRAFYVYYTRALDGALTVARYLARTDNPDLADPATGAVILTIPHADFPNHNGGKLVFGPDGNLYIGTGDGGNGGDATNNAQNLAIRLGKLLRIAVDGGPGYTVPPDNPFAGSTCPAAACPEIWAYGLRNPWRFSFDRLTGDLLIGDVGQNLVEEVDFLPAHSPGGANFGWRAFEGNQCFNPPTGCSVPNYVPPVAEYFHDASGGVAVTGGYRYRGRLNPGLAGYYVFGDFGSARVWRARPDSSGTWNMEVIIEPPGQLTTISSFGEDEAGELYVLDYAAGVIWGIESGACRAITGVPAIISEQGVYCLTGDLETGIATGAAIRIDVPNVTLDLKGWRLDGLAAGPGTSASGISGSQRNVVIRNGTIRGFQTGVSLGGTGSIVEGLRVELSTGSGLMLGLGARGALARDNQVLTTGGAGGGTGIVIDAPGSQVEGNLVTGLAPAGEAIGILVQKGGDFSVVRDNHVQAGRPDGTAGTSGIAVRGLVTASGTDLSQGVTVYGNTVVNADVCIQYDPTASGVFSHNVANSCPTPFAGGTPGAGNSP